MALGVAFSKIRSVVFLPNGRLPISILSTFLEKAEGKYNSNLRNERFKAFWKWYELLLLHSISSSIQCTCAVVPEEPMRTKRVSAKRYIPLYEIWNSRHVADALATYIKMRAGYKTCTHLTAHLLNSSKYTDTSNSTVLLKALPTNPFLPTSSNFSSSYKFKISDFSITLHFTSFV